ncbi:MAG: PEP/pyruvate-binding domain-containing protein [Elusimicrobiota bacterium]
MGFARDLIRRLFGCGEGPGKADVEALRIAFQARYHQFKLLLNANNKALNVMAEIERALTSAQPFGMAFVRERCTRASTDVYQIVKHLDELAPGKYAKLPAVFEDIRGKIVPFVLPVSLEKKGPLAIPLAEVDKSLADQVGGKIANLGEIANRLRLRVPGGFAITAAAYRRFLEHNDLQAEIDRRIQAAEVEQLDQRYALSAGLQQLIIRASVPEDIERAVAEQYRRLEKEEGAEVALAMRSSALGEDVFGASFAGQYRSELNVSRESLLQAYKEIVASKYSLPAMSYRLNRGIRDEDVAMCVGCLRMVDAVSGGVMYSRDPLNIRDDAIVINSAWGLPKTVVDGSAATDTFYVSRADPPAVRHKQIALKERKYACDAGEGVLRVLIAVEERRKPSLTEAQALALARTAVSLERHYGIPQDVEWALAEDGAVTVLQCRPLRQSDAGRAAGPGQIPGKDPGPVILRGGVVASPGAAAGRVFVVKKDADALRFPQGGVLVAAQALPRWASLLDRAAAVVTEQGSLAGHLANVAREFGVPALFGASGALEKLENGRLITVDADGRTVYEDRIESLLATCGRRKSLMEGSPVFEALKGAAEHIVPLRLLDPDAVSFKPENCGTFHDITRFCHEKSVSEMFRFGKDHSFPERSSKQLIAEVPMKWWVLNLDDGFREEVDGSWVELGNIVSIPMLALWEGITRFPWEGPPPIDAKGFLSVMFQATANPALTPGARSSYGDRNYFMISKNYCSLVSRLGFHFSIVEALVGDRPRENYIRFQFKGGATDFQRRRKRVLFVADIVEEHGFQTDVREDNLIARVEDLEKDLMESHLKILGYLSIHTRQLDMVMTDEAATCRCRSKIDREIKEMLGRSP